MRVEKKKVCKKRQRVDPMKELRTRGSYLNEVTEDLEQVGVKFFMPDDGLNIDEDYLTLPRDITDVTSRELGRYLNAFTQQKVYMRTIEGYAEVTAEAARRDYVDVSREHFSDLLGSKLSETAKEREINANPEVRELYEAWVDCKMKVRLIQSHIIAIEETLFMLSREVSRRSGDFESEQRNDNVQMR